MNNTSLKAVGNVTSTKQLGVFGEQLQVLYSSLNYYRAARAYRTLHSLYFVHVCNVNNYVEGGSL
jgi:hypothetical protein